ncbi:hypothetical protein N1851_006252 [Merluccius polli]|uniref:Gypsy retrotransposon integrase-like protein 1 n=1 Tax=Merluccius polli TaxID=89951 RepID=A0AA47P693_MERPO|nr:hypothetical protein N1851_006252 [Merluccius polli]
MADCSLPPPSPFLALLGEPPVPWPRWISSFETYILAAGLEDVSAVRKRALLLHCLGAEGQRVFGTLGNASTYTHAVELLKAHFAAPQSALLRRVIFRRRHQRSGESVTQFVADLRGLASVCKFGALQDEMIRDHLILHTNCDKIRERLLLENDDLTLAAALHLAVQVESALECAASLSTSSNSLALAKAAGPLESRVPLLHVSADSSEENVLLASQSRDRPHQPCGNCGSSAHNSRAQICPARGKTCSNCGKLNHFHKVCRSAPARASQPPTTIIHNVSSGRAPFKTCSLMIGDVTLPLLLDTGATVSLLNLTTYTQFFSREPLGQPTTTLRGYANSKIDIVGSLQLPVKYGEKTLPLFRFNIARHGTNLLGLDLFNSLGFTLLDTAGSEIHTVAIPWQQQWPMLFSGVGCLDVFAHQPLLDPQQYNFRLHFTPGRDNVVADLLSRAIPNSPPDPYLAPGQDQAEHDLVQLLHTPLQETVSLREIQDASADDPTLSTLSTYIRQGWPARVPDEMLPYSRVRDELSCWNDTCIARGLCTVVPSALRARALAMAHEGHLGIVKLKQRCRDVVWWPGIDREIETLVKDCTACLLSARARGRPEHLRDFVTEYHS